MLAFYISFAQQEIHGSYDFNAVPVAEQVIAQANVEFIIVRFQSSFDSKYKSRRIPG